MRLGRATGGAGEAAPAGAESMGTKASGGEVLEHGDRQAVELTEHGIVFDGESLQLRG